MITAVGATGSLSRTKDSAVAELHKQVSTLQQRLAQAKKAGADRATEVPQPASVSNEINTIQSQIERLILQAQLARLQGSDSTSSSDQGSNGSGSSGPSPTGNASKRGPGKGGGSTSAPYQSRMGLGRYVDNKA